MKKNDLLFLTLSGFFVVMVWIGITIFLAARTSTISEPITALILPIPGTFDTAALNGLEQRKTITPLYRVTQQNPFTTPTPLPSPTPVVLFAPQTATQGGNLAL